MTRTLIAAGLVLLTLIALPPARAQALPQPSSYDLDRSHTFVTFEVLHFDTATIRGRFGPLDGQAELDLAARRGRVQVAVDTAQVSTGLPVLDALLKRADLLDNQAHPKAYFVAESFEFDSQGRVTTVAGEFTLRGVSRGLALKAERWRCYRNPLYRREVCGGDFVGEFKRSDFGITHSLPFVADTVRLLVQVEGIRQSSP
ncbi:MAG: polyisoprenoid-binding protein [Betaproteobacteria bacterium]|nr:polyisoprenoid-binding protein [Betaproteobacteria bacterium]